MKSAISSAMASALALACAAPAAAQDYGTPYRPTDEYLRQQQDYQAQRDRYEAQRDAYRNRSADYRAARAAYDRRMADWEASRAAYDARYGYGAYVRVYGPAPVWDEGRWVQPAPYAGDYGRDSAYTSPIRCSDNSAVAGGVIGAIAGGVLGSNIAGRGDRTGGTVLGALVGGGVGAAVGHANDRYKCDRNGAYYAYSDTMPYQVSENVYRDDRWRQYRRMGCRLAPAPVGDGDYRYVRVCPDADGRYRITG
jgi:hypothetical protein